MPVDLSRQIRSLVEVAAPVSVEEAIARHRLKDDSPEVCPFSGPARFIGLRSGAIAALAGLRLQGGSEEGEGPLALRARGPPRRPRGAPKCPCQGHGSLEHPARLFSPNDGYRGDRLVRQPRRGAACRCPAGRHSVRREGLTGLSRTRRKLDQDDRDLLSPQAGAKRQVRLEQSFSITAPLLQRVLRPFQRISTAWS